MIILEFVQRGNTELPTRNEVNIALDNIYAIMGSDQKYESWLRMFPQNIEGVMIAYDEALRIIYNEIKKV